MVQGIILTSHLFRSDPEDSAVKDIFREHRQNSNLYPLKAQTSSFAPLVKSGVSWGRLQLWDCIFFFLLRLIKLAERQRSVFSRIYGYGVISVLFTHFFINIGMAIGLVPVIGIPLPFFSYGGSSLWGFTISTVYFSQARCEPYRISGMIRTELLSCEIFQRRNLFRHNLSAGERIP